MIEEEGEVPKLATGDTDLSSSCQACTAAVTITQPNCHQLMDNPEVQF